MHAHSLTMCKCHTYACLFSSRTVHQQYHTQPHPSSSPHSSSVSFPHSFPHYQHTNLPPHTVICYFTIWPVHSISLTIRCCVYGCPSLSLAAHTHSNANSDAVLSTALHAFKPKKTKSFDKQLTVFIRCRFSFNILNLFPKRFYCDEVFTHLNRLFNNLNINILYKLRICW